jgi:hypothetical protein
MAVRKKSRRTTVYLDPALLKALQYKALLNDSSVSEMINDAIRLELAEDVEDLRIIEQREKEPDIDFEEMLKRLKADGRI